MYYEIKKKATIKEIEPLSTNVETSQDRYLREAEETKHEFDKYIQVDAERIILRHGNDYQGAVMEILKTEAPLAEEYLLKRTVRLYHREKVTKVVLNEFNWQMYHCENQGIIRKEGFLYYKGMPTIKLRVPGEKRDVKYICKEELANGFLTLIRQNVSVTREGLYKSMTNLLGFSRSGEAIVSRYDSVIEMLKNGRYIQEEDGLLSLKVN